jgi:translation initiation factor 4G
MSICQEKPASLPPLDAIGIEPLDPSSLNLMRGGSGCHRTSSAALPPAYQASTGLGFSPTTMGKGASGSYISMGNFATGASKLSSEDWFAASSHAASVSSMPFAHPMPLTRTASTGGPTGTHERTHSKRGEKRNESNRLGNTAQSQIALNL